MFVKIVETSIVLNEKNNSDLYKPLHIIMTENILLVLETYEVSNFYIEEHRSGCL